MHNTTILMQLDKNNVIKIWESAWTMIRCRGSDLIWSPMTKEYDPKEWIKIMALINLIWLKNWDWWNRKKCILQLKLKIPVPCEILIRGLASLTSWYYVSCFGLETMHRPIRRLVRDLLVAATFKIQSFYYVLRIVYKINK